MEKRFVLLSFLLQHFLCCPNFSSSISSLWCCSADNPLRTRVFNTFVHLHLFTTYHYPLSYSFYCPFLSSSSAKSTVRPIVFVFPMRRCSNLHVFLFGFSFLAWRMDGWCPIESEIQLLGQRRKVRRNTRRRQGSTFGKTKQGQQFCRRNPKTEHMVFTENFFQCFFLVLQFVISEKAWATRYRWAQVKRAIPE